ncbi:MAG TPA: hypothetical protein PKD98_28460 [Anaerolineae bacterium]|nr:hypothetical protein [Anaerolineae bacterium]
MDPISIIVTALAAGAAAALRPTAEAAIKDAYAGLKLLVQRKYSQVDVAPLEQKPASEAKQASLAEDLSEAGATADLELLAQAKALLLAIKQHAPEAAKAIGIDLKEVEAHHFRVGKVTAEGTGIRVEQGRFSGDIDIGEVSAGDVGPHDPS